jgi:hypothetical protein
MRDQRRSHRIAIDLPATFQIFDVEMKPAKASISDVSAVGICFATKTKVDLGQKLLLRVLLPNKEPVDLHATAVWIKKKMLYEVREYRLGVKIDDPIRGEEGKFVKFYAQLFMDYYRRKK